ncbi:MAG: EamA family transporter [Acidobacteriia bacterium]|nr:EamA family transporter [Terriglobia bacterium]
MYRLAMAMSIAGTLLYHLAQKTTSRTVNPFLSLAVTYLVALAATLAMLVFSGREALSRAGLRELNWACAGCGAAIFLVEIGVLLAYRAGGSLKTLALILNTAVVLALVPIGLWFFKEKFDAGQTLGMALSLGGLYLLLR